MPPGSGPTTATGSDGRQRRIEDFRLLRGEARFLSDIPADGSLHAVVVIGNSTGAGEGFN